MDESQSSLMNSLPPFLSKTYEMVDHPSTNAIVSWSQSNESFIVWDPLEFAAELLPRFFKHNNYSSFIRQLNTYGFRKIDPEKWEFANDDFIRDKPHLMRNIHRRKPVHSHSLQNLREAQGLGLYPLTESERKVYKEKILTLKNDKQLLVSELEKHVEVKNEFDLQLEQLKDRFIQMEERHQLMLSDLSLVLQKPNTFPGLGLLGKKRRLMGVDILCEETGKEYNDIENSQVSTIRELYEQLDSSLTFWFDLVHDASQPYVSRCSNLDIGEVTSCMEEGSPNLSSPQFQKDGRPGTDVIDMNLEPQVAVSTVSEERCASPSVAVEAAAGVNDVFWEQFLTENPGVVNQPSYSKRKGSNSGKSDTNGSSEHGRARCSLRNGNNFAGKVLGAG